MAKREQMSRTRIAVAGAGLSASRTWRSRRRARRVRCRAVVDPAPAAAAAAAKAGVPLYKSLDELIANDRPDGVILATPNPAPRAAGAAVRRGGPADAARKADRADRRGRPSGWCGRPTRRARSILIGHHRAHSPIMAKAKEIVDRGTLGPLVAVMGSAVFFKPDHYFADGSWRREPGGGPDPDQHDPRSAQPADAVRRDRRRAGVRIARDARLSGGGHRRHQPALRQRRAGLVPAVRHRRLRAELGADVAGEQGVPDLSPTRTATS